MKKVESGKSVRKGHFFLALNTNAARIGFTARHPSWETCFCYHGSIVDVRRLTLQRCAAAIPDDLPFRVELLELFESVPGTERSRELVLERCGPKSFFCTKT
jgi:hypothetical protein